MTSYFYVAKLFKQSRRGDVKFIRKHQRKQEKYLKIRSMESRHSRVTGWKIHPDAYQTDVREDVFFILLRYSLKK
ncbi:MAG: hypothetical protein UR95_C0006G0001 [Parcubacteria group bacterium GW2011_GWC1_36_108]|nr:MAG: hypothetical protein UR95_C0006G0001 [Parcubacteria group bacterium GW2011_GWC1_36_108]